MKEECISFETAKLAKEKGFDIKCSSHWSTYDNDGLLNNFLSIEDSISRNYNNYKYAYITNKKEELFSAPTQTLLQRWLREECQIIISIVFELNSYEVFVDDGYNNGSTGFDKTFDTYEEALEFGLVEALKLIK